MATEIVILIIQTLSIIFFGANIEVMLISIFFIGIVKQIFNIFDVLIIPKENFPDTKITYAGLHSEGESIQLQDASPTKSSTMLIMASPIVVNLAFIYLLILFDYFSISDIELLLSDKIWMVIFFAPLVISELLKTFLTFRQSRTNSKLQNKDSILEMYGDGFTSIVLSLTIATFANHFGMRGGVYVYFLYRWVSLIFFIIRGITPQEIYLRKFWGKRSISSDIE